MDKNIYISGMHSGQNPCSGVGIARSLRKAFPELRLIGVDHWQGSTGLHDSSINDVLMFPQWKQIDDDRHADDIRTILNEGHLWISALDMEVHWLSENLEPHRNLLAPSGQMLKLSAKPAVKGLGSLDFRVPEFIPASFSDSDIHTFLRHHSWQCWLKSPYHDAKRISSWGGFERARNTLTQNWEKSQLFLQRHISGNEETIAFTAYQGTLLGAAHLQKRLVTGEGKTWSGKVSPVEPEYYEALKEVVLRMEWNGGGEIEYVRDPDGNKWIIECNPRFPAWIFGAALAGQNIAAKLISHVWKLPFLEAHSRYPYFVRVVQEIPAKEAVGVPLPADPSSLAWIGDGEKGKGGSSLGLIFARLDQKDEKESENQQEAEVIPAAFGKEIAQVASSFEGETPSRLHLEGWSQARFQTLANKVQQARLKHPRAMIGYSVKTSPTDDFLRKAKHFGFFAECISQAEIKRSLKFGFSTHEVILNGPGKFWPITEKPITGLHALYCDSIEEFDRVIEVPKMSTCLGFRIRVPKLPSRFGNSIENFDNFQRIVAATRKIKGKAELGFHFHMPSWSIGVQRWTEALESLIIWCQAIERLSGVRIQHFDLGGGFFPSDLHSLNFNSIQSAVASELTEVRAIYFEPGRSLTQDSEVLVSRVLDIRRDSKGDPSDIVVDACVAELPLAQSFTHRIFYQSLSNRENEACVHLPKGKTRILGRICMEDDILSNGLEISREVVVGDLILFGDAGGYERAMSYVFGRG